MKFRAKISKELLLVFHGVISTQEKLGEKAAILLTEDTVRISVISESIETPRCYSELKSSILFFEYKVESQSANTVLFEIGLSQLSKALASGKYSSQCQLKLVKRDNKACLCVETKAVESIMSVDVLHDIPIRVLKPTEVIYYMPPDIPAPRVALDLPKNKLMKTIVDKMLKFSKHVQITVYQSGRMVLKAEHSSAIIRTFYNGLQPRYVGSMSPDRDIDNHATVRLNLRKLSIVLNLNNLLYDTASLFMSTNQVVMMHVALSASRVGSVTYYLPVLVTEDDEGEDEYEVQQQQQRRGGAHSQQTQETGDGTAGDNGDGDGGGGSAPQHQRQDWDSPDA